MNREIKFRIWTGEQMEYSDEYDLEYIFVGYPIEGYKYMQFTGLKDKNGKDIYEGDIVSGDGMITIGYTEKGLLGVVVYKKCHWEIGFCIEPIKGIFNIDLNDSLNNEVIGNIYENSNLLK